MRLVAAVIGFRRAQVPAKQAVRPVRGGGPIRPGHAGCRGGGGGHLVACPVRIGPPPLTGRTACSAGTWARRKLIMAATNRIVVDGPDANPGSSHKG